MRPSLRHPYVVVYDGMVTVVTSSWGNATSARREVANNTRLGLYFNSGSAVYMFHLGSAYVRLQLGGQLPTAPVFNPKGPSIKIRRIHPEP